MCPCDSIRLCSVWFVVFICLCMAQMLKWCTICTPSEKQDILLKLVSVPLAKKEVLNSNCTRAHFIHFSKRYHFTVKHATNERCQFFTFSIDWPQNFWLDFSKTSHINK